MPAPNELGGANTHVYGLANALVSVCADWMCPIGPNAVTCAGMLAGLATAYAVYLKHHWPLAISLSILREFLDILDGVVARKCKKTSKAGAMLDVVGDASAVVAIGTAVLLRLWPSKRPLAMLGYAVVLAAIVAIVKDAVDTALDRARPAAQTIMGRNSIVLGPALVASVKAIAHSAWAKNR